MNRDGLQRLVRAATSALGEDTVVVIGSQSILGSFGEFMLPPTATVSVEADLLPFDDLGEVKADTIDGLLGADSYFAAKYGIYADGVSAWTAHLPDLWEQRLVRFEDSESGSIGLCLHPEDLCVAKVLAGRRKDVDFVRAVFAAGLVDPARVEDRLDSVSLRSSEEPLRVRAKVMLAAVPRLVVYAAGPPLAASDIERLSEKLQRVRDASRLCGRTLPELTPCLQDRRHCTIHP